MCVVVGRGGGLQIRRGEATRYAGFEAFWGPSAHLSPSQRLLGDWAGAGIVGPALRLRLCLQRRVCEREAGPQAPQAPAQRLARSGNATLLRLRASAGGSPPPPSTLPGLPTLPLSSSPSCSVAVWQP